MSEEEKKKEEEVWRCEGCSEEFHTGIEAQNHELNCITYANLYPDKQTELQKNSSRVKYSGLSTLVWLLQVLAILYFVCGIIIIIFLHSEDDFTLMEAFQASFLFTTPAVTFYAISELIKLLMDLQDNTYQSTELNLVMAESLKSIEDNIKSIAEEIKKK